MVLDDALIRNTIFYKTNLMGTSFHDVVLVNTDFTGAKNLTFEQLCTANRIKNIKPKALVEDLCKYCPEKLES